MHMYVPNLSAMDSVTPLQISLALSLHSFLLSSALPYKFQVPQPLNILISVFSTQEDSQVGFPLPCAVV